MVPKSTESYTKSCKPVNHFFMQHESIVSRAAQLAWIKPGIWWGPITIWAKNNSPTVHAKIPWLVIQSQIIVSSNNIFTSFLPVSTCFTTACAIALADVFRWIFFHVIYCFPSLHSNYVTPLATDRPGIQCLLVSMSPWLEQPGKKEWCQGLQVPSP